VWFLRPVVFILCSTMNTSVSPPGAEDVAPWVERLARVGYTAKAMLYFTVGILAAQAALGRGGRATDMRGALRVMHGATLGRIVLLVIAAGLLGYALWRLVEAVFDAERRGSDVKGVALRIGSAGRGVLHGALAIAALRLVAGDRSSSMREHPRYWTAQAFGLPAGELLVWIAGLGLIGYGLYQFYRAWAPKLGRQLRLGRIPKDAVGLVVGISRFGIAARGVVFCLIGFFLVRAAMRHDPAQAGGLRESLGALANFGRWPFVVVALGLVAYGVYQLVNARYRLIRVG
jgi:hypothetical protein